MEIVKDVEILQVYENPICSCPKNVIEILEDISYNDFLENYMLKNAPCIIKNVADSWQCSKKWIKNNAINWNYLKERYGILKAPVAQCEKLSFNSHSKQTMTVNEYVQHVTNEGHEMLYLKDWHLKRLIPEDNFYEVPIWFISDWLNEYAVDHNEDDFMFVYIGPKSTWTPLHADVYNSYSWSVNVIGRKKWIFLPPGEEDKLKDTFGNLPIMFDPDEHKDINYIEVFQETGDAVFVPSGWHHQVINEVETISVNHNWVNACNIEYVWIALNKNLCSVEKEILEFKDTPEYVSQCELILKSVFGMDFVSFVNFILYISSKRLQELKQGKTLFFNKYTLGKQHILFDLKSLLKIMIDIFHHYLFSNSNIKINRPNFQNTIQSITLELDNNNINFSYHTYKLHFLLA